MLCAEGPEQGTRCDLIWHGERSASIYGGLVALNQRHRLPRVARWAEDQPTMETVQTSVSSDFLANMEESREKQARAILGALRRKHADDPLKICVMVRVRRLFDLSLSNECFTVMIHVITCWICEGDAEHDQVSEDFIKEHEGQFVYDADPDLAFYEPDFRPRIAIRHLHEGKSVLDGEGGEDYFYRSCIDGKTIVTWEVEKLCTIGSLFDLCYYPVDVQALDICLELKTSVKETQFVPFPADATISSSTTEDLAQVLTSYIHLPDYALIPGHEYTGMLYTTMPDDSWTGEMFSGVKVSVWFQRRYQNDFYNIALVQFALTSLVAGVWAIDGQENIEDRIAADFTLVLAGVAMKFVLSQNLPPVSYVTTMENYINMTFLFVAIATGLHCLQSRHESIGLSDTHVFWIWVTTWIIANLFFLRHVVQVKNREVDLVRQLGLTRTADAGAGQQMHGAAMEPGEGEDLGDVMNLGMGGMTDVRQMLKTQKQMSHRRRSRNSKKTPPAGTTNYTNPLQNGSQELPSD